MWKKKHPDSKEVHGIPWKGIENPYVNVKWCQSAEYIDASLDEAVKQYGSVQAYIRDGLGITDKELVNFREQLLEPAK